MTISDFDLSEIYGREDGSYILKLPHGAGLYHCPNEGEWQELWQEVTAYVQEHHVAVLPEPVPVIEPETPEQMQARYTQAAQDALDAFARTRNYDGILSACSYATSMDAQFRLEGEYCVELRDQTWRRGYAILAAVLAGTMELPTVEEFLAMLPVSEAQWPGLPEGYADEAAE